MRARLQGAGHRPHGCGPGWRSRGRTFRLMVTEAGLSVVSSSPGPGRSGMRRNGLCRRTSDPHATKALRTRTRPPSHEETRRSAGTRRAVARAYIGEKEPSVPAPDAALQLWPGVRLIRLHHPASSSAVIGFENRRWVELHPFPGRLPGECRSNAAFARRGDL